MWAHLQDEPPTVTALRPDLPAAIDAVIARALAKDPRAALRDVHGDGRRRPRRAAAAMGRGRPPVEDHRAGLDHRSGTLDSRVVRRSRKPWIGVPVAVCTMAAMPGAGAVTDQGPAPLPPPVAGKTVNAKVRAGTVRFRLPGQTAFVALTAPQQLPIGTTFDTTAGRVTLTSAADTKGATQHAWFYEGTFTIGQTTGSSRSRRSPSPARCRTAQRGRGAAATTRKQRHLWGDGKGRFRTGGRFSSATVRGTRWVVSDRCDGTLTRVVRGSVTVRDRVHDKTVILHAGEQYLARAPGSRTP